MDPSEFRLLGDLLSGLAGPYPEGRHRTAVSRYYYAAFLDARGRLSRQVRLSFPRDHVHDNVEKAFSYAPEKELKTVGLLLRDLRKSRHKADYDLHLVLSAAEVGEAKTLAGQIVTRLANADLTKCVDPRRP